MRPFSASAYPGSIASTASRSATTRPASLISIASVRNAPPRRRPETTSSPALHVPDQVPVDVFLSVEHEPLLLRLELVHEKHQHNRDQERDQRRVERRAEILGHAGDVALHGAMRLAEREADAAHGAD